MGLKRKLLSNYKAKLDREYYHSNKAKRRNRIVNELANNITSLTQNIHDEPNGNVIISIPNSIPKEYQIKSTTFGQIKEKFFPKPHNSKGTNIQDNKRVMFDDRNDYGFEPWYQQHRGIAVFRDALKKSFPNHDITCKLLCTTEECKEYQLPHTDNRKYTCRFIDKSMHICLCKDGHATCDRDQFKMSRDTCPFTVFLAVETCTALAIGDGFGLESNSSWLINPRDNKIEMNNGLLISGSTPHAGVPFPSRKSCGCRRRKPGPRAHYRIFFDGSPNQKNCPYWPDPRAPQWKLSTGVEIESK